MSVLLALAGQWRMGLMGLAVAALLLGGWTANGWRHEAAQAKIAKAELRHEIERRVRADADRLSLAKKVLEGESVISENTRVVKEKVYARIKDDDGCDLVGISRVLNRARSSMPPTADDPDTAAPGP